MSLRLSLVAPLTGGLLSVALTTSAQPASPAPPAPEPSETVPPDAQPSAPEPPPPVPPTSGEADGSAADGPDVATPRPAEGHGSPPSAPPAPQPPPAGVAPPASQPAAPPAAPHPYAAQPRYPHPYGYPYARPRRIYRLPPVLPYEEGAPPPRGYRLRERLYRGMVIAGSVTFGSTWLLSAVSAGVVQSSGDGDEAEAFAPLFVPLAGPFVALGTTNANAFASFVLVVDGLAQISGLGMLIHGAITPKHEWVLDQARLEIAPIVTAQTTGLGARVTF